MSTKARDPNRDRSRKTMLAIDEFGYVTQVEALARLAAMICKVARKYGIGLIAKGYEEAVPGIVDLLAAVALQSPSNDQVVSIEQHPPATIAELRSDLGGAHDICEHDRGKQMIASGSQHVAECLPRKP